MAHACDLVGRGADGAQALSWHQKYVTQTKKAPSPLLNVNWKSKGGFLKKGTMCLWWFRIPMRIFFQFLSIFLPYLMIFWSSALPSARFTSKNHPNITKKNIGKKLSLNFTHTYFTSKTRNPSFVLEYPSLQNYKKYFVIFRRRPQLLFQRLSL